MHRRSRSSERSQQFAIIRAIAAVRDHQSDRSSSRSSGRSQQFAIMRAIAIGRPTAGERDYPRDRRRARLSARPQANAADRGMACTGGRAWRTGAGRDRRPARRPARRPRCAGLCAPNVHRSPANTPRRAFAHRALLGAAASLCSASLAPRNSTVAPAPCCGAFTADLDGNAAQLSPASARLRRAKPVYCAGRGV